MNTEGQREQMELNADNASIGEILQALSTRFALSYRLPSNINRTITGSYSGSLRQVLGRVLDGNDYIIRETEAGLDLVILAPTLAVTTATNNNTTNNNNKGPQSGDNRSPAMTAAAPVSPIGAAAAAGAPPPPLSSFLAGARAVSADATQP